MTNLLSRKFILVMATMLSSTWLMYEHVLTSSDYKAIIIGVIGVYVAGNVTQKLTAKTNQGE